MEEQQQCIFCHIANGQIPAKTVFEDDKVKAVLDINPAVPGHVLVLTKEHVAVMPQMDDELTGHVGMVAKQVSQSLIKSLKVEGTSVFVANGVVAGQRAPHFMLHVIPRESGDGVQLDAPGKQLDEASMKQLFNKLAGPVGKQLGVEVPELETGKPAEKKEEPPAEEAKEPEGKKGGPKSEAKPEEAKSETKPQQKKKSALDDIAEFLTK